MLKPPPTAQEIVAAAATAAFGRPLVQNNLRAMLVEAMIDAVLPDAWRWVSADWGGWDFRRADGVRLEVKQSAAMQTRGFVPADLRLVRCSRAHRILGRRQYVGGPAWTQRRGLRVRAPSGR